EFEQSTQQQTVGPPPKWIIPPSYTRVLSFLVPTTVQPGAYHLLLKTDAHDQLFEYSGQGESNNTAVSTSFPIESHPADLTMSAQAGGGALLPPTQGSPGQAITLPWTVTSQPSSGATSVASWTDSVYLSPSPTSLSGAYLVLAWPHSGVLHP